MKIATWNVNSVRARLERVTGWIDQHQPDVLCLQEIKTEEKSFPLEAFTSRGYQAAMVAQKTYNGVAIISKTPITQIVLGLQDQVDDPQARLIAGTVNGVRILNAYMPNGQHPTSDKFPYKLNWMERLCGYLQSHYNPKDPLLLTGDFNVAPEDKDVHDPAEWEGESIFHPDSRKGLEAIRKFGFVDVFRQLHPEPGHYSWWDYRMASFQKNRGLRIDHLYATPSLAERCTDCTIDLESRKGTLPSDHAAIIGTFR